MKCAWSCLLTGFLMVCSGSAAAQTFGPAEGEQLALHQLYQDALNRDPRARELELLQLQADLRLRNLAVERLPSVSASASAQYQTDVPTSPITGPDGLPAFAAPKDTYDASLRVDQPIVDPAHQPREALMRAELAEAQARLRATLYGVRNEVNEAFFAALLLQERLGALTSTMAGLEANLKETRARVDAGAALPSDAALVEATLLQHQQQESELRAGRQAALARLSSLAGRTLSDNVRLIVPVLDGPLADARSRLTTVRARPEYQHFQRTSDRVARQEELTAVERRPRLSAFGRAGYGQPGLNFIDQGFNAYALIGVQVQWRAWDWGTSDRESRARGAEREVAAAEEAAFTERLERSTATELTTIDQLRAVLDLDERIVALRETIERTTELRFQEGVVTASEYLDRHAESLTAQFTRAGHRVERAQATARLLTTLGLEVR
jgi:outer membrane protein TolC